MVITLRLPLLKNRWFSYLLKPFPEGHGINDLREMVSGATETIEQAGHGFRLSSNHSPKVMVFVSPQTIPRRSMKYDQTST